MSKSSSGRVKLFVLVSLLTPCPILTAATVTVDTGTIAIAGSGISLRYAQLWPSTVTWQTESTGGTQEWKQVSTTFTTPGSHEGGRLDMFWLFSAGTGWFDDLSLIQNNGNHNLNQGILGAIMSTATAAVPAAIGDIK